MDFVDVGGFFCSARLLLCILILRHDQLNVVHILVKVLRPLCIDLNPVLKAEVLTISL